MGLLESTLLAPLLKGLFLMVVLGGAILFIRKSGKDAQRLDDAEASKKLQTKIDNVVPIKPSEIEKEFEDGTF